MRNIESFVGKFYAKIMLRAKITFGNEKSFPKVHTQEKSTWLPSKQLLELEHLSKTLKNSQIICFNFGIS